MVIKSFQIFCYTHNGTSWYIYLFIVSDEYSMVYKSRFICALKSRLLKFQEFSKLVNIRIA